jgi:hypothetical protein
MLSDRDRHPEPAELERFMRGVLPRDRARAVVRHMLTNCRKCIEITHRWWRLGGRAPGLEALLKEMLAEEEGVGRRRTGSNGGVLR